MRPLLARCLLLAPYLLLALGLIASCSPAPERGAALPEGPYAVVLGTAQDGGLPQLGCRAECCERARRVPGAGRAVASLLVGADCALKPADAVPYNRSSVDPSRQRSSHVHTVVVDPAVPTRIFAADLGGDAVYTLTVDLATGRLAHTGMSLAPAGSGPRHLAVHPTKRVL